MTNDRQSLMDHLLKYWPIFASVIGIMVILAGHSISLAMDVNETTGDVTDLKNDVKKIQDVQVDINKLNVSNATLRKDVENVKEKITETNNQIQETNILIKNFILEQKSSKTKPATAPAQEQEPKVIYVVPNQQYQQRPQYQMQYVPQMQQRTYQPSYRNY